MADIFTKQKRSEIMSKIRCKETKPELQLYALVRSIIGRKWRIDRNVIALPGKPDFIIPSLRLAFFLDGCFYHSCPIHGHIPKSNRAYWKKKLVQNAERDKLNRRKLKTMGFTVVRYWEHDLRQNRMAGTERSLRRCLQKAISQNRKIEPMHNLNYARDGRE